MKFLNENINKDNIMLCDVLYQRGKVDDKYTDFLNIIYKDIKTGEKKIKVIDKPKIEIYFTKDSCKDFDYNKTFLEIENAEKHTCEYKNLSWYIAKQAGDNYVNYMKQAMEMKNYDNLNNIHKYKHVFGSDINIENWYRIQWLLEYDNDSEKHTTKQFMDIEVDTIDIDGFPRDGECPINAITIVDEENMASYTFLLNNVNNPQIQEFVDNIDSFYEDLYQSFDESYGRIDYKIYMYDDELEMLKDTFRLIHTLKRDFMLLWNGFGFDIPYIIGRIKELGADPRDIMCHPDFPVQTCNFRKDTINYAVANKGDYLKLSSYTKYLDQMILYAATRKGQSELRSHSLTYISQIELEDEKLDYSDEANIKTLPYVNYKKFVKYNIKDVLLQFGIERKAEDINGLYSRAYSNCVNYDKVFKPTVLLHTRAFYEYYLQGKILGNNINVNNEINAIIPGALVGDPLLNSETGIKLFGQRSKYLYRNIMDFDFAAMYPNAIMAFNIERHTMIGKLFIPDITTDNYEHGFMGDEYEEEIIDEDNDEEDEAVDEYDAGKDFIENYLSGDVLSIGTKWFNLPDFESLNDEFIKEFNIRKKEKLNMNKGLYTFVEPFYIDIEEDN